MLQGVSLLKYTTCASCQKTTTIGNDLLPITQPPLTHCKQEIFYAAVCITNGIKIRAALAISSTNCNTIFEEKYLKLNIKYLLFFFLIFTASGSIKKTNVQQSSIYKKIFICLWLCLVMGEVRSHDLITFY